MVVIKLQEQKKTDTDAKRILSQLADYLNVRGIRGLANYLGESEDKLYAWTKRGNIADTGAILAKCPVINAAWLMGESDEMLRPGAAEAESYYSEVAGMAAEFRGLDPTTQVMLRDAMIKLGGYPKEDQWKVAADLVSRISKKVE